MRFFLAPLLVLLVLLSSAFAGQIAVNSLPYTVSAHTAAWIAGTDTWDTVTFAGTSLTSTTNGITFANGAHHYILKLDDDTLIFGTDNSYFYSSPYSGARGIALGSGCYNITIDGGYILHRPSDVPDGDPVWNSAHATEGYDLALNLGYQTYDIVVKNIRKAEVKGYNSHLISGGWKRITIRDNDSLINNCYAYLTRGLFPCAVVNISGYSAYDLAATDTFHFRIANNTMLDNAHAAIYAAGNVGTQWVYWPSSTTWRGATSDIPNRNVRVFLNTGTSAFAGHDGGIAKMSDLSYTAITHGDSVPASGMWLPLTGTGAPNRIRAMKNYVGNIFAGSYGNGVVRSTDDGLSWTTVNTGLTNHNVLSLEITSQYVFAGTDGGGVFRSSDNGNTWSAINTGLGNLIIYSLLVNGTNLYAGTASGVYYSSDYGTTWSARATSLPAGIVTSIVPQIGGGILASVYGSGVYSLANNNVGTAWISQNSGLTDLNVQSLLYERSNLYAGTYSRGIFRSLDNGATWSASFSSAISNKDVWAIQSLDTFIIAGSITTGPVVQIDSNRITVDSRNNRYTTYSGSEASNTNAYGISTTYLNGGSRISYNTIRSGSSYLGGRGIMCVAATGMANDGIHTNLINISHNNISIHEGFNVEFGTLYYTTAFRLRQNCRGVMVDHNSFVTVSDTITSVGVHGKAYGNRSSTATYEMTFSATDPDLAPWYITYKNNACSALVINQTSGKPFEVAAFDFELTNVASNAIDSTVIMDSNTYYSEGTEVLRFGQYDGQGAYMLVTNGTFHLVQNDITPKGTFNLSDPYGAVGNVIRDGVYKGIARSDSLGIIYYYQGQPTTANANNDIAIERTTNVFVRGTNGRPVNNAVVTFTNAYGQSLGSLTTNANGRVTKVLRFGHYFHTTPRDSVLYNLHSFAAQKGAVNTTVNYSVTDSTYSDTITLNTYGDGQWAGLEDIVDYSTQLDTGSNSNMRFFIRGPKRQVAGLNLTRTVLVFRGLTATYASRYSTFQYYADGVAGNKMNISNTADEVPEDAICVTQTDTALVPANFGGSTSPYTASFPTYAVDVAVTTPVEVAKTYVPVPYQGISVPTPIGGNSALMEIRGGSGAPNQNQDLRYTITTNGGVTWSAPAIISTGFPREVRSGAEPWGFNTGKAVVVAMTANGTPTLSSPPLLRMWSYNGTSWSTYDSVNLVYAGRQIYPHREYGFAVTPDSVIHIVMSDTSASANNSRIVDVYKKIGSAASGLGWRMTVLYTAQMHVGQNASSPNADIMPHLLSHCGVSEYSGILRAVYSVLSPPYTNPADQVLYSKRLLSDSTWSNPIQISTHNYVSNLVMANPMPTIHGDRAVVGFMSIEGGQYHWYLVGILGSGTSSGAGPVISLGTIISFTIDSLHNNY